jgi:hypothetical protein
MVTYPPIRSTVGGRCMYISMCVCVICCCRKHVCLCALV